MSGVGKEVQAPVLMVCCARTLFPTSLQLRFCSCSSDPGNVCHTDIYPDGHLVVPETTGPPDSSCLAQFRWRTQWVQCRGLKLLHWLVKGC